MKIGKGIPDPGPWKIWPNSEACNNEAISLIDGRLKIGSRIEIQLVDDFDWYPRSRNTATRHPEAIKWSSFYDYSPGANWQTQDDNSTPWGMLVEQIPGAKGQAGSRCPVLEPNAAKDGNKSRPNQYAFHLVGGKFLGWGGGVGHALWADRTRDRSGPSPEGIFCPNNPDIPCPALDQDGSSFDVPYANMMVGWDLSKWDGITFWARRGPESQPNMHIQVTDKYTSDGIASAIKSEKKARYCQRHRICYSECLDGKPCTIANPNKPSSKSNLGCCYDPSVDAKPADKCGNYLSCGAAACIHPRDENDEWDVEKNACKPFRFQNGESAEYCVDPRIPDDRPAEPQDRCGDGYLATVTLSAEWRLFMVPFSEFHQQGIGKPSPLLDKSTLDSLSLSFGVGWVDVWIDDIGFYRNLEGAEARRE